MKKFIQSISFLPAIVIVGLLISCNQNSTENHSAQDSALTGGNTRPDSSSGKFTFKIFTTKDSLYGYDVYADDKLYIHQDCIPAVQGTKGFKSGNDAAKVAGLIVTKLERNILPPSVTPEEIDSLGISVLK